MSIDYMQMLLDLMDERQKWVSRRDEAIREISRLAELIRATMKMVPPEKLARYEPIFERIEQRPLGLSMAIRACFTARAAGIAGYAGLEKSKTGKAETGAASPEKNPWLTPVEIRDALNDMGFPFENYKANPLASIHTTLKRMVPGEVEVKTLKDGQKVYRLKGAGEWAQALAEVRQWLKADFEVIASPGSMVAFRPGTVIAARKREKGLDNDPAKEPAKEKGHGASGSS